MTPDLLEHVRAYVLLAAAALGAGTSAGLLVGTAAAHFPAIRAALLALANVARVAPSLAVLTFFLPILGVGFLPAFAALALLASAPVAINADAGFRNVSSAAVDAARGMGMNGVQTLMRVEWPLAFPVVFAGVRTAATEVIAGAVLAAFVGAGGLGEYITTGLQANQPRTLWTGVAAIAVIAVAAEISLAALQRRIGEPA